MARILMITFAWPFFLVFSSVIGLIHRGSRVTIFTIIVGQNPVYGYNASGPMLDVAFETVKARYPAMFANITLVRLYNAAPVAGCVETADIMPSLAGRMSEAMDESNGFSIVLSPGKYNRSRVSRKTSRKVFCAWWWWWWWWWWWCGILLISTMICNWAQDVAWTWLHWEIWPEVFYVSI